MPSWPDWTNFTASPMPAREERLWVPVWTIFLYLRAAFTSWRPSQTLWETGFSTYTSLPAWMAQMAARECQWFGVAMQTRSISLSSNAFLMSA